MRRLLSALTTLAVALTISGCEGHASNPTMPNVEPSLIASPTVQPSLNPSVHSEAICAPNLKCASVGTLPTSTTSQSGIRGKLSITPVDCPSGASCVIQGQSITQTGNYWNPNSDASTAGVTVLTNVSSTTPDVTFTVNPNPVAFTPATFSVTINAGIAAPVGLHNEIVSGSAPGWNLNSASWPFYICDAQTGSCLTPAPSPTPVPSPVPTQCPLSIPAPIPAKTLEIAARTAHVVIPFTDAALPCNGTLTWKVTGAPAFFTNIHFGQPSTNVPYTNTLIFDVDRDTTPGDYPLNITLTSSSLVTSAIGLVTVRVPHVVLYDALENPSGIFELDQNDQIYVPDATQFAESGTITVVDFPVNAAAELAFNSTLNLASTLRKAQSVGGGVGAECIAWAILDNSAHDKTSGTSPAQIQAKVNCVGATPVSVTMRTTYVAVKDNAQLKDFPDQTFDCSAANVVPSYYTQPNSDVSECATKIIPLKSYPGEASKVLQRILHINVVNDILVDFNGHVMKTILNTKNVSYPAIQFDGGNKTYVPFPTLTKPLENCPRDNPATPTCPKSVLNKFRGNTIQYYGIQGWTVPAGVTIKAGAGYQVHHILPSGCGGDDTIGNGVFLTQLQHTPFTNWWLKVPPCAPNNMDN